MPHFSFTAIRLPLFERLRRERHGHENQNQNDGRYVLNVLSNITSKESRLMDNGQQTLLHVRLSPKSTD